MNLARARNIEDLRVLARRKLPRLVYDYVEGGAEEHVTLRANREAFEAIRFVPRTLVNVSQRSQRASVLGMPFDSPFGISPLGAAGLCWRDAECALARAAREAGIPFVLSTHSFVSVERVASTAGAAPWFQLYASKERAATEKNVMRALQSGSQVMVLTADVPVGGNREYNDRNGFGVPFRVSLRHVFDGLLHPQWLLNVYVRNLLGRDLPEWGTRRDMFDWRDFDWLRKVWPRKLLVKGILALEDAQLAAEHGADGIIISNHGGRQLDGAPATLDVLPQIAAAMGGRLAVMVDGGVRRGSDIVKALALGADMVLVGRPALYGAAAAGEAGVGRALQILKSEVDRVMALLGCNSIEELGLHCLYSRDTRSSQRAGAHEARLTGVSFPVEAVRR